MNHHLDWYAIDILCPFMCHYGTIDCGWCHSQETEGIGAQTKIVSLSIENDWELIPIANDSQGVTNWEANGL